MNVLGLFSGIGGFELGFERAGMRIVGMCECDPHCRGVLSNHWPGVPVFKDVRLLTRKAVFFGCGKVDLICGGFPCQGISLAGRGAGLKDERSGLWYEMLRVVKEVKPTWCVLENVSALRSRGLEEVLGGLDALGYDAEWHCITASSVGAPHRRDRIWIVAHFRDSLRNANRPILEAWWFQRAVIDARRTWEAESPVHPVDDGVPRRLVGLWRGRIRVCGNALVPQIAEIIGAVILRAEEER